jgi:hypothetical protein
MFGFQRLMVIAFLVLCLYIFKCFIALYVIYMFLRFILSVMDYLHIVGTEKTINYYYYYYYYYYY